MVERWVKRVVRRAELSLRIHCAVVALSIKSIGDIWPSNIIQRGCFVSPMLT